MQFRVTLPLSSKTKSFSMRPSASYRKAGRDLRSPQGICIGRRDGSSGTIPGTAKSMARDTTTRSRKLCNWAPLRNGDLSTHTEDAHPMHLHLVQFQILQRQGFNPLSLRNGALELVGTPRRPAANEAGWKDTAVVNPREVLTIIARFEGFTGRYVFHCHMLEHEDQRHDAAV
jgi:spore coat protein A